LPAEPVAAPASALPAAGIQNSVTDSLRLKLQERAAENIKNLPEWSLWQHEREQVNSLNSAKSRSLQLDVRQREWQQARRTFEGFRAERRTLGEGKAFPTETIELGAVQTAIDAHRARLAARTTRDGAPLLNRMEHGGIVIQTTSGNLRQLWLGQIDFGRFSGDSEALAVAFATGSKLQATAVELGAVVQSLTLLEHKTDEAVLACFSSQVVPSRADPIALRKGVESVLVRMTELDTDLRRPRPALDVPLREALRVTAAWTDSIEPTQAKTGLPP